MSWVLIVGIVLTLIALPIAGRRVGFLYRLITHGQPAPDRIQGVTKRTQVAMRNQLTEVLAQRRLLKWTVPGAAHFFVFWAFLILATVYLEAYGSLFTFPEGWAIPIVGHWDLLGFLQDFIAVMALFGLATFALIRLKNSPERLGRKSRFKGSHLGGAWLVLFMIFNVIWTMFLFRGASAATGNLPYGNGAFMSQAVGRFLDSLDLSEHTLEVVEGIGLILHIGVMLVFLVIVLNSKHLHIFLAPLNVMFKRTPIALGAVKPLTSAGQEIKLDDIEEMDEDTKLGIGSIEDFSWKGMLDFTSCTECGRCQSQCPAWNTEKPLSPKMLIMNLRDHAFHKAPYILASEEDREKLPAAVLAEAERPLVGETEGEAWEPTGGGIIDPDVLWSCVTCGACVQQCPVDIEHVDHIVDMRRYQVLIESNFPAELNGLFKGLETKGNPWNMNPNARMEWAEGLDFDVKVVGEDVEDLDEVDWLFWVGCAGAYEDRAKKTTRAVAELLDMAGVSFAVLGNGETCTGDSARRAGNEFVFQQLAMQNAEVLTEVKAKKVVSTCAHCFNTLKNEYATFGVELIVVHHTQLLNQLVREGRLTPVESTGGPTRTITYHDPCYIGRHNKVYSPPRELLAVIPSTEFKEMERNSERSFCCGAGGARMWMEEQIGTRINMNRTTEAVGTGADQIAVGCPFCRVMLSDGLTTLQSNGEAREEVEVLDVAQLLLASVKRAIPPAAKPDDEKADDTGYPSTVAHDGTEDPEAAPAQEDKEPQPEPQPVAKTADVPDAEPAESGEVHATQPAESGEVHATQPAESGEVHATTSRVIEVVLPAGVATVAETWSGQDVESILEGDDVDISEFKTKLKAELKAEVLAELKEELEGALNSDSGTSEPVTAEAKSSGSAPAEKPAAKKPEPAEDKAEEAQAAEEASAGANKLDQEPEPEAAAAETQSAGDKAEEAAPSGDDRVQPESKPTAESDDAEKAEKKDEGDDGPMLIGSL